MKKASWMDMGRKYILFMIAVICFAGICMGCGKVDDGQEESTGIQIKSGDVESAENMTQIGVYLDVDKNSSEITDVKYKISGDIGIVRLNSEAPANTRCTIWRALRTPAMVT